MKKRLFRWRARCKRKTCWTVADDSSSDSVPILWNALIQTLPKG